VLHRPRVARLCTRNVDVVQIEAKRLSAPPLQGDDGRAETRGSGWWTITSPFPPGRCVDRAPNTPPRAGGRTRTSYRRSATPAATPARERTDCAEAGQLAAQIGAFTPARAAITNVTVDLADDLRAANVPVRGGADRPVVSREVTGTALGGAESPHPVNAAASSTTHTDRLKRLPTPAVGAKIRHRSRNSPICRQDANFGPTGCSRGRHATSSSSAEIRRGLAARGGCRKPGQQRHRPCVF